jgi:putative two-component system response regulator
MTTPAFPATPSSLADPASEIERLARRIEQAEAEVAALRAERDQALNAIANLRNETFFDLARSAERNDGESPLHTARIGIYTSLIASELGCPDALCALMESAAQLHDIGKIGIHASILSKPGPLTTEEWKIMREHPRIGASIIGESDEPLLRLAGEIAMTHHEHFNGVGYPQGLAGEAIPLAGRIVGLADFFDALTHDRSYRKALPVDTVLSMISERRGEQFDPQIVDAFLRIFDQIEEVRVQLVEQEAFGEAAEWDSPWWMLY